MPLFLGNTYSSREKGTRGLQFLSKTQRKYTYINMWIERNKTNGGECKQWVNLVEGKWELFVLFFDSLLYLNLIKINSYQKTNYILHLKERLI